MSIATNNLSPKFQTELHHVADFDPARYALDHVELLPAVGGEGGSYATASDGRVMTIIHSDGVVTERQLRPAKPGVKHNPSGRMPKFVSVLPRELNADFPRVTLRLDLLLNALRSLQHRDQEGHGKSQFVDLILLHESNQVMLASYTDADEPPIGVSLVCQYNEGDGVDRLFAASHFISSYRAAAEAAGQ